MRILVLGSGGREHALTWKLRESQTTEEIYCAPGNPGIGQEAECLPVDLLNPAAVAELAAQLRVDLTVAGPEAPLAAGVADEFMKAGLAIVGPAQNAARFESSKTFAKQFMQRYGIPTARFATVGSFEEAVSALRNFRTPVVVKADGLAAGKGVVVAKTQEDAERALDEFMRRRTLGCAGERVVIEEALAGEELSFIVLTDGRSVLPLPPSQDHKALFDNDQGPNTGGMGAYSDDASLSDPLRAAIMERIVAPTLAGMSADGIAYRGFLYFGLMLTPEGPHVLEYNVRMGDPEAQPLLMRLRSDLAELLLATANGSLGALDPHWSPNPAVCVVLASKGYPSDPEIGKPIVGYDLAESLGGVKVFHAGTVFHDNRLLTNGGRVLGVTASGEDLQAATQRAYAAVSKIHFDGMHYRRDIGAKTILHRQKPYLGKMPSEASVEIPNSHKYC